MIRGSNENDWHQANVLKSSQEHDLALLMCNDKINNRYFRIKKNFCIGENIYTIGNPNGIGLTFSKGIISSNTRKVYYKEKKYEVFETSLILNEGNSGGPIFNSKGELLGLVSFRIRDNNGEILQGIGFSVPSSIINEFI